MALRESLIRFRSFWIFPILSGALLGFTFHTEPRRSYADLLWLFPAGLFIWTILEYGLHRFVFHTNAAIRSPRVRTLVRGTHSEHHAAPRDIDKLLVKTPFALGTSAVLLGLISAVTSSLSMAAGIMSGVWAGFLVYEAVHYCVHLNVLRGGVLKRLRRRHLFHHGTNAGRCFGVTTRLWDCVFRTDFPKHLSS
jgi:sterol desaturase/sphingolipid hydroxylase (fatty acid hydroxylase superfamily)